MGSYLFEVLNFLPEIWHNYLVLLSHEKKIEESQRNVVKMIAMFIRKGVHFHDRTKVISRVRAKILLILLEREIENHKCFYPNTSFY
jgi:hypothetical protein